MELGHVELGKLSVSVLDMRHGKKAPDVSDILPSIRARGILVPLLVRPNGSPDTFEIVAGRGRYHSAQISVSTDKFNQKRRDVMVVLGLCRQLGASPATLSTAVMRIGRRRSSRRLRPS